MASPSPSPSGSSRRLSELLDQQQEPFSLDLYLLEKGCSPAVLDAAVGGGGACSTCCWPRKRSAGRTQLVWSPAASKKSSCASSVLRLLLCKILRGKMTTATAKKRQLPAIDRRRGGVQKPRTHGDSESSVPPEASMVKKAEEEVEDNEEDDVSKQLSPVSVLEQSHLEHEQKALLIFRDLLQADYSPTLLDLLAKAKTSSRRNSSKSSGTKTSTAARKKHAHLKDDTTFEEALAKVTDIIASETAGEARAAWPGDVLPEWREVGASVAAAVLDALVEETAAELMGTDGP